MNHLTEDQLSALADDALAERERSACEAHLASCEACRTRLAELSALDDSLSRALEHDPGEAYFESFAERVAARIAQGASAATEAGARRRTAAPSSTKRSLWAWLFTPRGLSLAGSTAAVLAVAGIVWLQRAPLVRVASVPPSASRERIGAIRQEATPPAAKSTSEREGLAPMADVRKEQAGAEPGRAAAEPRDADALAARVPESARAREVKRDERGEDVPVRAEAAPGAATSQPTGARSPAESSAPANPYAEMKRRSGLPAAPAPAAGRAHESPSGAPFAQASGESQSKSETARAASEEASKALAKNKPLSTSAPAAAAPSREQDDAGANRAQASAQNVIPPTLGATKDGASACGTVSDTRGTPIGGARVTVANDPLRSARSGADGRFCLPRLAAGDTLSILRVGFEPQRIVVGPATSLAVRLEPIGTLGPDAGMKLGRTGSTALVPPSGASSPGASMFRAIAPSADLYAGQSGVVQRAVLEARMAADLASRERTANAHEHAADRWEQVARSTTGAASLDARFQVLVARREAQRLEPTAARAERLRSGLDAFVAAAPRTLAERDSALRWQGELRAASKPTRQ